MTIDLAPLANIFGFLALACYIATLLPTHLKIVFPKTKQTEITKGLLKHRRMIGILAFLIAIAHAYLLVRKRNFDFFDLKTSWIYIQGILTFTIFTLLAITSNNWSIKRLKKNWKRLHSLTYLAIFLLTWHVWDKMSGHWSYLTPFAMFGMIGMMTLFLVRRWIEHQNKQQKAKKKLSQVKLPSEKEKISA